MRHPLSNNKKKNPPTREYRMWNLVWIGLLLLALGVGLCTFFYRAYIPDGVFIAVIVIANLLIAAAIVIDAVKLRRLREEYQKGGAGTAAKSKEARAEQKRLHALEVERRKEREGEPSDEPADESSMTFRERVAYRARKSAQSANVKGSGL